MDIVMEQNLLAHLYNRNDEVQQLRQHVEKQREELKEALDEVENLRRQLDSYRKADEAIPVKPNMVMVDAEFDEL